MSFEKCQSLPLRSLCEFSQKPRDFKKAPIPKIPIARVCASREIIIAIIIRIDQERSKGDLDKENKESEENTKNSCVQQ
jgi:hypothetical protein